jgi:hypothetical protein
MRDYSEGLLDNTVLWRLRWRLLSTTSLVLALASPAWADDLQMPDHSATKPAVSAVNGKLAIFGGDLSDGHEVGVSGALTLPLGHRFGMQLDGMFGSADDESFYGVGAHLFWRDPARALFGIYASHVSWDSSATFPADDPVGGVFTIGGADVSKLGVEGALYIDRISLEGLAAYQSGSETGFAGKGTVAYYPLDDLRLDLSIIHLEGNGVSGSAGAEWMLPRVDGFSLFANASVDEDSDWQTVGGIKFHFSPAQKSLIQRHREDDPGISLPEDLYLSIGNGHCPAGTEELGGFCDGVI